MVQQATKEEYAYSAVNQDAKKEEREVVAEKCIVSGYGIGIRHLQVLLYFLLGVVAFGFRVSMSVGIVAMTDPTASSNPDIPTYDWKNKNVILSAFFWGYILPQVFAAYAAKKYGAKWFLIGTMTIQSLLSILTPLTAANLGAKGVMFSRAVQGFCQGFIFPSCAHFLSRWAPPQERSRFGSTVFSAGKGGNVLAILVTGLMASTWYGWPLAFYFFGCLGFLWCISMALFGSDDPKQDPRISHEEREFIEKSLGNVSEEKHGKTPWLKIITSVPVWALLAVQAGHNYSFWTLLTQIPTYMNYVMAFDMKSNSFWSAMPYLTFWILSFFFGAASDFVINKGYVSRSSARKIFTSIGLVIPAIALVTLGYTNSGQSVQAISLLILAVGFNSAAFSGFAVNHIDLAPNHAGTLMGFVNGLAQISGIIAPLVVQYVVKNERDPLQWRNVFFLAAALNVIVSIIYSFFGSGDIQPWNSEENEKDKA